MTQALATAGFDDGDIISGYFAYDADTGLVGYPAKGLGGGNSASFPLLIYKSTDSVASDSPRAGTGGARVVP